MVRLGNIDLEFIFNERRRGQILSIDRLYSTIDTEYIFHCEDDWEFYKKRFAKKIWILKNPTIAKQPNRFLKIYF